MTEPKTTNDDGIDYRAEGNDPGEEKDDPTAKGYDDAVRKGPGVYGVAEGEGGVFGTSGGGSFAGGMHVVERPVVFGTEKPEDETKK